uniref:Reverse transcriptase domain-containing protein n=1 Tax=Tanacetum cinerariifolium TaxID=118510 RepID=A0A6L2JEJ4_TANCI|nr:reverse transcriptase domain-containing protein [Tanacetum cinerariifolium]
MTTPIEKRNASKFCEFHGEVGHTTDECMHLKRQKEEMLKAEKPSHLIKELKQNHEKEQAKIAKKGETSGKDKPLAILMVQPWQRIARKRITQTFSPESIVSFPTLGEEDGTEGPMIIEAEMGGHCVHHIYVDGGSSSKILEEIIWPLGQISLLVKIGDEEHSTSAWMNFMVVRSPSPYNGIIRRPGSSRIIPLECSMVLKPGVPRSVINQVTKEKIQVAIHPEYPEQTIAIGSTLTEEGRKELCGLLRRHLDVFAWKPTNMTGVSRHIAEHRLNFREGCLPIRQKKRGQAPERNKAISEEVKNWRMCVDFKDLNKAFPKDGYPLPEIDWKVESLCGEGTFLGYKVDVDGLRVCPDKVKAVIDLPFPKCLKDVQKLNGKLASLNRFLSKSAEKSLPIFKTLKKCTKKSDFQWTTEVEGAFKEMKQSIAELQMLTAPKEKEELIMYLAAAKEAISAVLMTERDGKQAHTIVVITDQPIKQLLSNPEVPGRLLKWRFELGEHDIQYRPRTSIKGQILADFIVERPKDDTPDTPMEDREELPDPWLLFTDGSSCIDGSGAGLIITNPEGMEFTYALRFRFNATNNEAEYEALIAGLRIAGQTRVQNLQANVDSKLVANQVNEIYIAKESSMIRYLEKVKNLASTFKEFSIKQIPRGENKKADTLSKITSTSFAHLCKQVLVEEIREKSIDEKEILVVVEEEGNTWMTPVYEYLKEGILPEEKKKARTVCLKAGRYAVINEVLYKKSFLDPWLRCVGPLQENYFLREIYEGSCNMHARPRSVVAKALRSEARSVATITGAQVKKFVWDNIVCRSSNGETPFSLTYGAEAVIPTEIGMPTMRTAEVDMVKNNDALGIILDLLEEKREQAAIEEARNKAKMEIYYNARVRSTSFRPRDIVYQSNEANHAEDEGKLRPK